jgi:hypothetical protein
MKTTANCPPKKRTGNQTMQQRSLFRATHEPIVSKNTRLDDLLAEITPDNIHAEEGFGGRVGREIL